MKQLRVYPLPEATPPDALAGGTSVVIDVLRATTTITYALAAGARGVIPCLTIADAQQRAARLPAGQVVLAGERRGMPIDGFDLGNSPGEFTAAAVGGKTVVLTTTNGTKALLHCRAADRVFVGALANLSALCAVLSGQERVDVVCAGTDGRATDEDLLVAGAIVERLAAGGDWTLDAGAESARAAWQSVVEDATGDARAAGIVAAMSAAAGGRNLIAIGLERDIEIAAAVDRFAIVPCYDANGGRIEIGTPAA